MRLTTSIAVVVTLGWATSASAQDKAQIERDKEDLDALMAYMMSLKK
jgi:hypothetical protein